jgi:hypothetical protein
MPKLQAEPHHVESVEAFIERENLSHLTIRKRGDTVTLVEGPPTDRVAIARFRRITKQWWTLEIATHTGRWEPAPVQGVLHEVLDKLVAEFPWVLAPRS